MALESDSAPLNPELQTILTDLAVKYFGAPSRESTAKRAARRLAAEMLISGKTRQAVAAALEVTLSEIPTLLPAPQRLQ
jgi:hypothetical protein